MGPIGRDMAAFEKQLRQGSVTRAYRALLSYMTDLRAHFLRAHPDYVVSAVYQGHLDMTYFAVAPAALKQRRLKVAIVFDYGAFRFEAWLAAGNRQVQQRYWELASERHWEGCRVVAPGKGVDAIVACELAEGFDLDDREALTARIERRAAEFVAAVEDFLAEHDAR